MIDGLQGAKHHTVLHIDQAPTPYRLHHLRVEQLRLRHPARLRAWPFGLPTRRLHPLPIVGQQGRQILPKPIGEKQRGTVGGSHLRDLVDHALRHREGAVTDVDGQQQFALRVHRSPDPLGCTL